MEFIYKDVGIGETEAEGMETITPNPSVSRMESRMDKYEEKVSRDNGKSHHLMLMQLLSYPQASTI